MISLFFFVSIFFSSFSAENKTLSFLFSPDEIDKDDSKYAPIIFEDPCRRKIEALINLQEYSAYKDKHKNVLHHIKSTIYFINQNKQIDYDQIPVNRLNCVDAPASHLNFFFFPKHNIWFQNQSHHNITVYFNNKGKPDFFDIPISLTDDYLDSPLYIEPENEYITILLEDGIKEKHRIKIAPPCHFIICTNRMILPTKNHKKIFFYFIESKQLSWLE